MDWKAEDIFGAVDAYMATIDELEGGITKPRLAGRLQGFLQKLLNSGQTRTA